MNVDLATGTSSGGDAANDTLTSIENLAGSSYDDLLTGNSGNNVLNGGLGNDTITGGAGNDTFVFSDTPSAADVDWITDFSPSEDTIQLESEVFTALTASSSGNLTRRAFYIGAAAHDANDRIIYNPATGALIYDSNGDMEGEATQFATLDFGLSLTRADFVVV